MLDANLPWIESPFFEEILSQKNLTEREKNIVIDYHTNGFIVLPNSFSQEFIDDVKRDMDEKGFNPEYTINTQRDQVRVQDLWQHSQHVKHMACDEKILEILHLLYEREPVPFQTLNFKVGTQQRAHADTIHFSSLPARFMCGVWVALEDITQENGAVFYCAKSHKTPEFNFAYFKKEPADTSYNDYNDYENFIEKIVTTEGFEKKPFYAKKGDALIWSSNIIHGGSPVTGENVTRYSQVTHYYFENCIYYTPMLSNMVTNELMLRNNLVNIKTNKAVIQNFNGTHLKAIKTAPGKYILNNRLKKVPKILRFLGDLF